MTQNLDDLQELQTIECAKGADCGAACAAYVQKARQEVLDLYRQGRQGRELIQLLSASFDRLVTTLFRRAQVPLASRVCLMAQGGYGRAELFPFSDLDLLLLYDGGEDALSTQLIEQLIYPLWDAKVSVGYAVRTMEETLKLAQEDLSVCTALLDARFLAGDEGPYHALTAVALRELFGPRGVWFLTKLKEERAARHQRYGETVYLLEPNIKLGKGGLRDLSSGLWAAKACLGISGLEGLAQAGGGTIRQTHSLVEAQDFLQTVRLAMHLHAGRAQDHLKFELQELLGLELFPAAEIPGIKRRQTAVAPSVERLMHALYRHARVVVLETEGILDRCAQRGKPLQPPQPIQSARPRRPAPALPAEGSSASRPPVEQEDGEHFAIGGSGLQSTNPNRFWEQPAEILRAFQLALVYDLPLESQLRDVIAEAAAGEPGEQLTADAQAAHAFIMLLCDAEHARSLTILEQMHDLGVVTAIIPELKPCTGRIQHDLYHVYTVDLHTLYVVALIKNLRSGGLLDQHAMAGAMMQSVEGIETLFLAALLHDVGKPLGHGHAAKGARLAAGVAARLGLSMGQVQTVQLLVAEHLTMAHFSQRRDLADPTVIRTLADRVGTVDVLRQLYLLTLADTAMTGPGNLTEWKHTLLDELFMRTFVQLSHGELALREERERQIAEMRDALILVLSRSPRPAGISAPHGGPVMRRTSIVPRLPTEMFLVFAVEDLVFFLNVALEFESTPEAILQIDTRPLKGGASEVTICCWDSPGRLATITGVMLAHRIEVLAAQVYTIDPPAEADPSSRPATILDIFTVAAPEDTSGLLWTRFRGDLQRALRDELSVPELVQQSARPSGLPPRITPRVEIVVSVDNAISDQLTVIDVQAPDRRGLIYAITRTLSERQLTIHLSKVATEAGRVVDIFYVSDQQTRGKLTDEERLADLRLAITAAIRELEPQELPRTDRLMTPRPNLDGL